MGSSCVTQAMWRDNYHPQPVFMVEVTLPRLHHLQIGVVNIESAEIGYPLVVHSLGLAKVSSRDYHRFAKQHHNPV